MSATEPLAVAQTVVIGVIVFVLGQSAQRFILEPIQEQRRIVGEIAGAVLVLANVVHYARPMPEGYSLLRKVTPEEASHTLRVLAGRLQATLCTVPGYRVWASLRLVPPRAVVLGASRQLVLWSNSIASGDIDPPRRAVATLLRLPVD